MARSFAARRRAYALELHAGRPLQLAARLAEIEKFALAEAERVGKEHRGKPLDAGVVFLHRAVEETARGRDLVLDVGEVGLQLLEVGAGLEVRIGFAQREQAAQRAGELVLG